MIRQLAIWQAAMQAWLARAMQGRRVRIDGIMHNICIPRAYQGTANEENGGPQSNGTEEGAAKAQASSSAASIRRHWRSDDYSDGLQVGWKKERVERMERSLQWKERSQAAQHRRGTPKQPDPLELRRGAAAAQASKQQPRTRC
jgi:hypothetical protein